MGSSAIFANGQVVDVDAQGLVRRLLLYDKYVLVSTRLQRQSYFAPVILSGAPHESCSQPN
jgi:hypothetical protein